MLVNRNENYKSVTYCQMWIFEFRSEDRFMYMSQTNQTGIVCVSVYYVQGIHVLVTIQHGLLMQ